MRGRESVGPALKPERLWTRRDVADYLRVNPKTVPQLGIPRVAIQGRGTRPMVRYDPAEVRAWVEARKSRSLLRGHEPTERISAGNPVRSSRHALS